MAPARVSAPDFGQLFDTPIDGQVYAQPLVANGTLFVATENNNLYALDPISGAILQSRLALHPPWKAADLGCPDLSPNVGITGTPAIDPSTNTAYFFAKTYASGTSGPAAYWAHAVDVASLQERPGFPVLIQGQAANQTSLTFDPTYELQRPGILLLGGVVYAAFAGHCDIGPYQGWLVGVSTSSGTITTLWAGEDAFNDGAGIWQTGGAPLTDGAGTFIVATGNGELPSTPTPGNQPPNLLGQAWVRLRVQGDGSLQATDFFMPYDALSLNTWDADFGSGGPVGLPDSFGTSSHPHLGVGVGKQGYVYLLDRDNLGGLGQGLGGGDNVVQRIGPYGGVWSKPAVWPGNGGWVYLPTASGGTSAGGSSGTLDAYEAGQDGSGNPTLARVAQAPGAFGFGSSAPVVTSDGTTSGSALAWIIWSADATGVGGQLRAYDAVPSAGTLNLRYSAPIGQANKFTLPGVAGGRVYVAARDGHVKGFGSPVDPILTAPAVDFGLLNLGGTANKPVVFTATRAVTVNDVDAEGDFAVLSTQPALPASLAAGQTITANVAFTPSQTGVRAAGLVANTDQGPASTSLTGTGQLPVGKLQSEPAALSFGGTALGRVASGAVTFTNVGGAYLTIQAVAPPSAPFSVTGAPASGTGLDPGQSVTVTLSFTPTDSGTFTDSITVDSDAGSVEVPMSGSAGPAGNLQITPSALDFGQVSIGATVTRNFTIQNTGGVRITLTKSKPPGANVGFGADSQLAEGTTVDPGASQTLQIHFTPAQAGAAQDHWVLTADDGNGPQTVLLNGRGGMDSASSGCGTPGSLELWPLLTLLPWALRRRRA